MRFDGLLATFLILWRLTVSAMSSPNRIRRQTIDTTNISDDQFVCLLQGNCNLPANTPSPGCTCVKWWLCNDASLPRGDSQGIVAVIDTRTTCANDPNDICCDNVAPEGKFPTPTASVSLQCGQRNEFGVAANFKGLPDRQAQFGEFPWMAVVMRQPRGANSIPEYVSGGSLIHSRFILTVAHYVRHEEAGQLMVRLGEWDFQHPTEPIPHQDIAVNQIILHPNYVPGDEFNDMALLVLERDATLGPTVGTVCLPTPGQSFEGSRCYSSGWGKDMFGKTGKFQQILKAIDLPVVNHGQCERALKTSPRLSPNFFLHESFICAGGEPNKDVCTGDGGSPLVCPLQGNPTTYVQAGIVSWGLGCGQAGMPGVYTAVGEAVNWIRQILNGQNAGFDLRVGKQ